MAKLWKKGRGKLGPLQPLVGAWEASAESPMGVVRCTRTVTPILNASYLQLVARWTFGTGAGKYAGKAYEELAVIGADASGVVTFSSFTSDGKRSHGVLADVTDLHPEAIGFEADMPAGRARMAYWPEAGGGFCWVAEARTKKGWSRMAEHHYHAVQA
jgi:hypothetical protein